MAKPCFWCDQSHCWDVILNIWIDVRSIDKLLQTTAEPEFDSFPMADSLDKEFSAQLYSHLGILHKICRSYKRDPDDRSDLFQEIIFNAWKSYPKFEGRSKFSTWLYRVALNTALYQNRKDRFFGKKVELELVQNHLQTEQKDDNTELLWMAINRLDESEKSIVVLYLEELPYKEISEITGLTEGNIAVKLNRIKSKMKKILQDYGAWRSKK